MKYKIVSTKDGSKTIDFQFSEERSETMHSIDGAWTETQYIYGEAIHIALDQNFPPHFLSVGLGLGYIEMLIVWSCLNNKDLRILSYEKEPLLTEQITSWLYSGKEDEVYDPALVFLVKSKELSTSIKIRMRELLDNDQWKILGALEARNPTELKYSAILYDAFSGHSQPELWEESFLSKVFESHADAQCIFSTYAAKGSLNRALAKSGFEKIPRKGFSTKRESTLALRG